MINNILYTGKINSYGVLRQRSDNSITELVTLSEAKDHLRITNTDDDTYITTLISVARSICESYIGFLLAKNSNISYYLDDFPTKDVIYIHGVYNCGTVIIKYRQESDDAVTTFSASNYSVDNIHRPGRIILKDGSDWPSVSSNHTEGKAVEINMTNAGPASAYQLPKAIHQAILMTIGHLYENRQDVVVGSGKPYDMPKASEHLLNPHRIVLS